MTALSLTVSLSSKLLPQTAALRNLSVLFQSFSVTTQAVLGVPEAGRPCSVSSSKPKQPDAKRGLAPSAHIRRRLPSVLGTRCFPCKGRTLWPPGDSWASYGRPDSDSTDISKSPVDSAAEVQGGERRDNTHISDIPSVPSNFGHDDLPFQILFVCFHVHSGVWDELHLNFSPRGAAQGCNFSWIGRI